MKYELVEVSGESCANCLTLLPVVNRLAAARGTPVRHVEVTESAAAEVQKLQIGRVPTLIVFKEGREIAKIHPNMVVKIPMTVEGLKACKQLTSEGIKTNVTLIFTANQALLAARAGATYVSPFLGRLDDISVRGVDLIREIAEIFAVAGDIDTQIIAASIRHPMHVTDCALAGADIATVPYAVIEKMTKHPLTDAGIIKFQEDYKAVFGE